MTDQDTQQPGTAVERRPPDTPVGGPIGDLDQAIRFSKTLAFADILPDSLRGKPGNVLAMVLYGQDLGLSPMQAIQGIYVVKGKPQLAAQTWIALTRRAGHTPFVACKHCEHAPHVHTRSSPHTYEADHDSTRCTFTVIRGDSGERHSETFTIEDARRAKLAGKDVWVQYPRRMLLARAVSDCCRFICPEIALGFYAEGDEFTGVADTAVEVETPIEVGNGQVQDAEVVEPEAVAEQVQQMASDYDFSVPSTGDGAPAQPETPTPGADYLCETCDAVGDHFEDECPQAVIPPRGEDQ